MLDTPTFTSVAYQDTTNKIVYPSGGQFFWNPAGFVTYGTPAFTFDKNSNNSMLKMNFPAARPGKYNVNFFFHKTFIQYSDIDKLNQNPTTVITGT